MLHALRNYSHAIEVPANVDGVDTLDMYVGPARDGVTWLEVGVIREADGGPRIIHAMKARAAYLDPY